MTGRFALDGVVVVTGAAGMLGSRFSAAVAGAGAAVVMLDVHDPAPDVLARVTDAAGDAARVLPIRADITSDEQVERAARDIEDHLGPVTGLVNCAAIDAVPGASSANPPFERYASEQFDAVLDVNLQGAVRCCQAFGGRMAARGAGAIVNVASTYGLVGPDQRLYESIRQAGTEFYKPAVYSASKAALIGLSRYLATYWGPRGVRVNTLSPGGVRVAQDARFVAEYAARTPLGRMAEPSEYDGAVVFLLSEAASYMTGANLVIDGGFTAW